jgi:hypothetical protein
MAGAIGSNGCRAEAGNLLAAAKRGKSNMKTRILSTTLVLGIMVALGLPAGAQTLRLKADIPFEFQVGHDSLPAGSYTIATTSSQNEIVLSQDNGGTALRLVFHRTDKGEASGQTSVTFHRYGDRYFLSSIQPGWTSIGFETQPSRGEKEAAQSASDLRQDYQILARR